MIFQKTKCLCKIFKNTTKQSHSTFGAQLRFRGRPGNNNGVVVSRIYLFCGMAGFEPPPRGTTKYDYETTEWLCPGDQREQPRLWLLLALPTYGLLTRTFLWHDTTQSHHHILSEFQDFSSRVWDMQFTLLLVSTCFSLGIWVCHCH